MTNERKWTAGPWRTENRNGKWPVSVVTMSGKLVAPFCGGPKPHETANAHLIAAAPELYEALEELLGNVQTLLAPHDTMPHDPLSGVPCISTAQAALAKARGEQS